jgi:hypothetical protein
MVFSGANKPGNIHAMTSSMPSGPSVITRLIAIIGTVVVIVGICLQWNIALVEAVPKVFVDADGRSMLSTPIRFGGKNLEITFPADHGSAIHMEKQFCDQRGADAGIQSNQLNEMCVKPIGDLLMGILNKELEKQTHGKSAKIDFNENAAPTDVTLDIGGKKFELKMIVGRDSPSQIAYNFCKEHSESLHISERDCNTAVTARLEEVEDKTVISEKKRRKSPQPMLPVENDMRTVDVDLMGTSHAISFKPKSETASAAAKKFCVKNMSSLGIKFSELNTKCIDVIQSALERTSSENGHP